MNKKVKIFKPKALSVGQVYRVQNGDGFAAANDKYRTGSLFEVGYIAKDGSGWDVDPHLGMISSKITMFDIRREYVKLLHDPYTEVKLEGIGENS